MLPEFHLNKKIIIKSAGNQKTVSSYRTFPSHLCNDFFLKYSLTGLDKYPNSSFYKQQQPA